MPRPSSICCREQQARTIVEAVGLRDGTRARNSARIQQLEVADLGVITPAMTCARSTSSAARCGPAANPRSLPGATTRTRRQRGRARVRRDARRATMAGEDQQAWRTTCEIPRDSADEAPVDARLARAMPRAVILEAGESHRGPRSRSHRRGTGRPSACARANASDHRFQRARSRGGTAPRDPCVRPHRAGGGGGGGVRAGRRDRASSGSSS